MLYLYGQTFIILWPGKKYSDFPISQLEPYALYKSWPLLLSSEQCLSTSGSYKPNSPFNHPLGKTRDGLLSQFQSVLTMRNWTPDTWLALLSWFSIQPCSFLSLLPLLVFHNYMGWKWSVVSSNPLGVGGGEWKLQEGNFTSFLEALGSCCFWISETVYTSVYFLLTSLCFVLSVVCVCLLFFHLFSCFFSLGFLCTHVIYLFYSPFLFTGPA